MHASRADINANKKLNLRYMFYMHNYRADINVTVLLHYCPAAGYLSLKKSYDFQFTHDLPVGEFYAMV